jgi:tRNA (guanine-N7-)-methyltransferase
VARLPGASDARIDLRTLVRGAFLEIEIGPGPKAGFLVERCAAAPEAALVGLEIRRKWAHVGDERLAKLGFGSRARVFCEDARHALPRFEPDASVRRVFLHFPDPWWKKRHQKRLVIGDALLQEIRRLLEPSGELFIQTDVEERAQLYRDVVSSVPGFVPAGDLPNSASIDENPYGARSPREHRAIADGLPVFRLRYRV